MSYIVLVNPSILKDAGMPLPGVLLATCVSASFACLLMGFFARYPIALAPGMGLNAYFTYTVVKGMGIPWQVALGAVFLSGVCFLILTVIGVRQWIVEAIPHELYAAVGAGIGLFIAFIGLRNAGIIVAHPATFVTMGNLREPNTVLALVGILLIAVFQGYKVRAAILLGMLATTLIGVVAGLVHWQPQSYSWSEMTSTIFQLDVKGAIGIGLLEIVFVFLFVDLFDNIGTLVAVGHKAQLMDEQGKLPRINRILTSDACATIAGSLAGTTTVVGYIESAAGVAAGGRSGVVSIVCGLLFLAALFVTPLIGAVPSAATAPALVIVGGLMMTSLQQLNWEDEVVAVPAFLTLISIPLTFSIANGLAFGIIAHVLLKLLRGQGRSVSTAAYVLAVLLMLRFLYLGSGA
jgi:adenine/guanine/hypoxanthine permease